ncbi:Putative aminotransferase A [Listeria fleischmannii subsp. fleischmannii]|uniref:Aminotransferase A n=1 Tax=Listeria fleischmannii subsp. fleischmannii TaxID=1671902 RepID=A0A2X3J9V2_9LIST|nr:Putative aminotransferase A [Listeria fleischmannii subsp. fleischmannii]
MRKPIRPELSAIKISGIRRFNSEISDIDGILKLTLGEPDFDTPEHVKQAAINAINDNFTNYTNNAGTPELVSAAANYFNEKYQLGFTSEEVIVTIGATEAIAIALETILNPGDEVILPDPIYPGYEPLIHLMGAIPVKVDTTESAFKLTPAQLKSALSKKTKALILPYPPIRPA